MSAQRWSIVSSTLFVALMASAASARAQVHVRVGDQPPSRVVNPSMAEVAIYLGLYGHPDTARRHIDVRVRHDCIELTGGVASESERLTAHQIAANVVPNLPVEDHLELRAGGSFPRAEIAWDGSTEEQNLRFTDVLARKFPDEILRELTLTVYLVGLPLSGAAAAQSPRATYRRSATN